MSQPLTPALMRQIAKMLNELGIDPPVDAKGMPTRRMELVEKWDTQDIPLAANTEVEFFQTTRAAHARGVAGCNLDTAGILDLTSDHFVVGIACDFLIAVDSLDVIVDDLAKVRNYGILKEVRVTDRRVLDPAFISSLPINRGFTLGYTGHDAAAVNVDQAVNGRPGGAQPGFPLAATNRFYVPAGEKLVLPFEHRAAANLSAALPMRVHLTSVRLGVKGAMSAAA